MRTFYLKNISEIRHFSSLLLLLFLINMSDVSSAPRKKALTPAVDDTKYKNTLPTKNFENYVYQSIEHLTEKELLSLIDSLLDAETIDKFLIKEINQYVQTFFKPCTKDSSDQSLSIYPANQYYYNWNTQNIHAYSKQLSSSDTSILLVLTNFNIPVNGKITSNFGYRNSRHHNGIDIDLRTGTPVVSAFEGMVRIAERNSSFGNIVIVRHYNGLETFYAHLSKIKVKTGQLIKAGQLLGLGGNTGRSHGSHLHFETRFKGIPINPKSFISFDKNKLQADSVILRRTSSSYMVYAKGSEFHTVKKGESVYTITRKYGMDTRRLYELNGISTRTLLKIGQKLRIS